MAFGPDQIGIGSAPDNAVIVQGATPHHARHRFGKPGGALVLHRQRGRADHRPTVRRSRRGSRFRSIFARRLHAQRISKLPLAHPAIVTHGA